MMLRRTGGESLNLSPRDLPRSDDLRSIEVAETLAGGWSWFVGSVAAVDSCCAGVRTGSIDTPMIGDGTTVIQYLNRSADKIALPKEALQPYVVQRTGCLVFHDRVLAGTCGECDGTVLPCTTKISDGYMSAEARLSMVGTVRARILKSSVSDHSSM